MGLMEDREVPQEQVRVPADPADPRPERDLAAGSQGQRPAPDRAGLELVRPDKIARAAVAARRSQDGASG